MHNQHPQKTGFSRAALLLVGVTNYLPRTTPDQQTRGAAESVGLMVAHRLRRWPNISPTLGQRLVFLALHCLPIREKSKL